VATGSQPRSMAIAPDGKSLYLVNYDSNTVSKIRCADMRVLQVVNTNGMPIGITYVAATHDVWVSCYSGVIMVFHDG
jgi:YVTN family beta-propeller protein